MEVSAGVPLRVRFLNPETGYAHERQTTLGGEIDWARQNNGNADGVLAYATERAEDQAARIRGQLGEPRIVGEETITTATGEFGSVHMVVVLPEREIHYWLSPDIPGTLIRVARGIGIDQTVIAELIDITEGNLPQIDQSDIVEEEYLE